MPKLLNNRSSNALFPLIVRLPRSSLICPPVRSSGGVSVLDLNLGLERVGLEVCGQGWGSGTGLRVDWEEEVREGWMVIIPFGLVIGFGLSSTVILDVDVDVDVDVRDEEGREDREDRERRYFR